MAKKLGKNSRNIKKRGGVTQLERCSPWVVVDGGWEGMWSNLRDEMDEVHYDIVPPGTHCPSRNHQQRDQIPTICLETA